MHAMTRRAWACLMAALCVCAPSALAFDQAGHFFTSYALVRSIQHKEYTLVALCAQLPDMASDLDAVAVYKSAVVGSPAAWYRWGRSSEVGDNEDIRRMITAQHLLHALTGGDSAQVEEVAKSNIDTLLQPVRSAAQSPVTGPSTAKDMAAARDRGAALCALGFAFHFFGDAVAHRQLRDDNRMYATGMGHAKDLTYPDRAMCDTLSPGWRVLRHCVPYETGSKRRFAAWMNIWERAKDVIDITEADAPAVEIRGKILKTVIGDSGNASDTNDWLEGEMRTMLSNGDGAVRDYENFILSQKSDRSCENVLASAFAKLPELRPFNALTCADAWKPYDKSIRDALDAFPRAREALGSRSDFRSIYLVSPLLPGPVSAR